jgi:hypothetical protein
MTTPFTPRLIASSPTACQYRPASLSSPSIIVDPCEQNTTGVDKVDMVSCVVSNPNARLSQPPSCRHSGNSNILCLQIDLSKSISRKNG